MACIPHQWRQTVTWGSQPSGPCPTMARGSGRLRGSCSVLSIALWSTSNPDVFVEFSERRRSLNLTTLRTERRPGLKVKRTCTLDVEPSSTVRCNMCRKLRQTADDAKKANVKWEYETVKVENVSVSLPFLSNTKAISVGDVLYLAPKKGIKRSAE